MADMASELEALAFRLRRAGEDGLRRELTRAMNDAVKPVSDRIREELKPHLPDPYAEVLDADLIFKVTSRNSGSVNANATAALTATTTGKEAGRRRLRRLDAGVLAHPLYGRRRHWYAQGEPSVKPGWFSGPAQDAAPQVRAALEQALADVSAEVTRGA